MRAKQNDTGMSYDTKTIIVVLLLVFVYPVGIILMLIWKLWPLWLRIILTVLLILPILFVCGLLFLLAVFLFSDPKLKSDMNIQKNITAEISQAPNQSQIETMNWEKYTNTKYGFSFNYPKEWSYFESPFFWLVKDNVYYEGTSINLGPNIKQPLIQLHVGKNPPLESFTLDNYVKTGFMVSYSKDVTINNLVVKEVHHKNCPTNTNCITIVFTHDGNLFNILHNIDLGKENDKNLPILYQILSTFKSNQ